MAKENFTNCLMCHKYPSCVKTNYIINHFMLKLRMTFYWDAMIIQSFNFNRLLTSVCEQNDLFTKTWY